MQAMLPIAAAIADLTPVSPVPMGGFGGAERLTRHADGRLEANIVILGEGEDAVVLVSIDTLFAGRDLTRAIVETSGRRCGLGAERILVLASHTHFAPMLDASKPALGRADPDEIQRCAALITKAILSAQARPCAAVRSGSGRSDLSVNRRRRWRPPTLVRLLGKVRGDIYMCDNPSGPRDPLIRTCVWLSPDGAPLAALWSFACHPVFFPRTETASADYVGVVREALRRRLGAQTPVIFAPGCMGDAWPRSPRPWKAWSQGPGLVLYGPRQPPFDHDVWRRWSDELAKEALVIDDAGVTWPLTAPSGAPPGAARFSRLPVAEMFDGVSPVAELQAKSVVVPGVGRVITLSCEPVAEIAALVAGDRDDLVLGYEGDIFGYLPTDAMIAEGGYESERSMAYFGLSGRFRPGLDARVSALGASLRA